jgi:type III pantothenate kinase
VNVLVDAGNSWIKCQFVDGRSRSNYHCFASAHYTVEMDNWFCSLTNSDRIVVANVIGESFEHWFRQKCVEQYLPVPEFVFTPPEGLGVRTAYDNSENLGVDRYLAIVAAYQQVGGAAIVIDCGTAVTIDAISKEGIHQGGVIIPGLQLMKDALGFGTVGIGKRDSEAIDEFARSTEVGVHSGALFAVVGGVREVLSRQHDRLGGAPEYVFTGGAAKIIADQLGLPCRICDNLVFDGLLMFANNQ